MSSSARKAKIKWHCRRGMLELDLLLNKFAESHLDSLLEEQLTSFENLLSVSDPELYSWLMGTTSPAEQELASIVTLIQTQHRV